MLLLSGMISVFSDSGSQASGETAAVRLAALNIGKADCMLLLWEDQAFLIDAGYEQTYPALKTMLAQFGVDHLNGVILTHCHQDHYGGLALLARENIPIDNWYAGEIYYDVKPQKHPMLLAAAAKGSAVTWLKAGNVIPAGGTASFTVLGPINEDQDNENNNSLVLRFSCPAGSMLLAGDMKEDEEYDLLRAGSLTACDVLKVGHHGDNKATSLRFLQAVQPKAAVILTSTQEEWDTPAHKVLTRLSAVGCSVAVSQDYHDAILVTVREGVPQITDLSWEGVPEKTSGLRMQIDLEDDLLTIYNDGTERIDLTGWSIYSTRGDEIFTFEGGELAPGGQCAVGSRATGRAADFSWNEKRVWHQKKLDRAILYDAYGRPVARTENGLPE